MAPRRCPRRVRGALPADRARWLLLRGSLHGGRGGPRCGASATTSRSTELGDSLGRGGRPVGAGRASGVDRGGTAPAEGCGRPSGTRAVGWARTWTSRPRGSPTLPGASAPARGGHRADAPAAYVRAPELRVERLEQRYTRLEDEGERTRYDYASPVFDFRCVLVYDSHGLVLDYPGISGAGREPACQDGRMARASKSKRERSHEAVHEAVAQAGGLERPPRRPRGAAAGPVHGRAAPARGAPAARAAPHRARARLRQPADGADRR